MSDSKDDSMKVVYVGNLAANVTKEDLCQLFALESTPYLKSVCKCEMQVDSNGKSKGFCFITAPEVTYKELINLNGIEFYGRPLCIEESNSSPKNQERKNQGRNQKSRGRGRGRGNNRGGYQGKRPTNTLPNIPSGELYGIFDCAANLTNPKFFDGKADYVFARMKAVQITYAINTGLTPSGNKRAQLMAKSRDGLFFAAGIHPHHANDWNDQVEKQFRGWCADEKCVCVGEIGIDNFRCYCDLDTQIRAFSEQAAIAAELNMPMLVHERSAKDEVMKVLSDKGLTGKKIVIQCFTGDEAALKEYLDHGFYIGVTGFIAKDQHGKKLRDCVKNGVLPLNRIILQSDAPFMFPHHENADIVSKALFDCCANNVNEPCTLPVVVRVIASALDKSPSEVASACNENAQTVFGCFRA